MRRVIGVFLIMPMLCFAQQGQYQDTIKGRLTINYNQPLRMKAAFLAGGAFETQGVEGSVFVPSAFADFYLRPSKWYSFHGAYSEQFQVGWQYQKVKNTRNFEVGAAVFVHRKTIDKIKTFTAGTANWLYDFHFPVKVLWNLGFSGNFRFGNGVFNSGTDPNTSIRFMEIATNKIKFLEQVAVPYQFSEVAVGFVVNTSSNMKLTAHLPFGQTRARRMKTFTEFRVEAILGQRYSVDNTISIKPSDDAFHNIDYSVIVNKKAGWGWKLSGHFRRKWLGFKFETGIRPGIYYRFSEGAHNGVLDRSYLILGMGIGWM